jgi:energy-coupling factor transporter ATP-binding protein EcfA2
MNKINAASGDFLNQVGVNMTVNDNNIEVDGEESVQSKIETSLNAAENHPETVVASLDGFKLIDDGSNYLSVGHSALQDSELGIVGKNEYNTSKNKAELLSTIIKDSMLRVANETTIKFEGCFVEPVIEKVARGCDQCEATMINGVFCHEHGCPNSRKQHEQEDIEMESSKVEAEDSWLGSDLMSEDPEPYADSEQIDENEKYVLWSTPYADHTSYWVSDKEGFELATFNTEEEARNAMATGEGLEMVEEASVAIKQDESGKSHMTDHLAQSIQAEEQVITAANDKIKTEAVNALVAMLQSMGHGSSKIAEVSESSTGYDVMATIDSDGALRAVSIPVTVKEGKVVLPKKSLVSELISKGLNIQAALTETFSQEVLEKIAAIEELENYKEAEANQIIAERLTKTAGDEPKTQFEGTNEQVILNKHLIPADVSDLSIGDVVHIDGISYKLVSKTKDVLSKGAEDDGSQWTFEKVTPISK